MRCISALCLALLAVTRLSAGELGEPVAILAAGEPLDVERLGYAAPCVADFDRDGIRDLLIGEFFGGRLRIYRNRGTDAEPRFDDYTLFQDGERSGCIYASCCMGFAPQVVDLDGDGRRDIISGNWTHEVILFRGLDEDRFAEGEAVKGADGLPINFVDYGVTAHAADWDVDGDLDLLAGTIDSTGEGDVYLVRNNGTAGRNAFGKPEKLLANAQPIVATDSHAAPVVVDWDRDGRVDLLLGCGDGSVRLYKNTGTPAAPLLADYELLVPSPAEGSQRGGCAKPCVVDWNSDGRLDLLVGDVGAIFDKELSAEEEQARTESLEQQSAYLEEWGEVYREYRELAALRGQVPASELGAHQRKLAEARKKMTRLSAMRSRFAERQAALTPGKQTHGRVWLFLRQSDLDP